ncbi:MAG: hypothetical protein WA981_12370 [Glaciecola sp.]
MSSNASRDYPFDTEFVYGLMQQEKALLNEKQQLEFELSTTNDLLAGVQTQVLQSQDLILASEAKYRRCESDKQLLQNQQSFTQTQASQCGFEKASLTATQDKLKQVNQQLNKLENDYNQTKEALDKNLILLDQARTASKQQVDDLKQTIVALEKAINAPISLSKHYLSARYCSKPKFDSLICVVEFLVRPSFTKPPITQLKISIVDKNEQVVAEGEYNSAISQLYRLNLRAGEELPAGEYSAIYNIDNQTIRSETVVLSQ